MKIQPVETKNGRTDMKLEVTFPNLENGSRNKLCILPAQCIYVFPVVLAINQTYFTKHYLLGPFLIKAHCFLCGTNLSHI